MVSNIEEIVPLIITFIWIQWDINAINLRVERSQNRCVTRIVDFGPTCTAAVGRPLASRFTGKFELTFVLLGCGFFRRMFGFFPAMPTLFQADLKLGPGTPSNRKLLSTVVHPSSSECLWREESVDDWATTAVSSRWSWSRSWCVVKLANVGNYYTYHHIIQFTNPTLFLLEFRVESFHFLFDNFQLLGLQYILAIHFGWAVEPLQHVWQNNTDALNRFRESIARLSCSSFVDIFLQASAKLPCSSSAFTRKASAESNDSLRFCSSSALDLWRWDTSLSKASTLRGFAVRYWDFVCWSSSNFCIFCLPNSSSSNSGMMRWAKFSTASCSRSWGQWDFRRFIGKQTNRVVLLNTFRSLG